MKGRRPTAEEKRHMDRVAQLPCVACREWFFATWGHDSFWHYGPVEIHHIDGKTKPGAHFKVLPLCPRHHRIPGKSYVSRADGKKLFEAAYGTEQELLDKVQELLGG